MTLAWRLAMVGQPAWTCYLERPEMAAKRTSRSSRQPEATRRRLLDAAFESLVEKGYAGTTTMEVCRRAGASRGTMLHHFPTKATLLLASMEDVIERRVAAFAEALPSIEPGKTWAEPIIRMLWEGLRGPATDAWIELSTAARTDPELKREYVALAARLEEAVTRISQSLIPDVDPARLHHAINLLFSTLNWLSLDRHFKPASEIEPVIDLLVEAAAHLKDPPP